MEKILSSIDKNPGITIRELEVEIRLSRRGIEWNINKLKKKGKLVRVGPDKGGKWKIIR